jgi:hypothetical protein
VRFVIGIALALGVAFTAYGAAASLNVFGGAIQYGEDTSLTCTDGARVLGWGLETDTGLVHFVRIGVNDDCVGNDIFVNITSAGAKIAGGSLAPIPAGGNCDPDPTGQVCVKVDFTPQQAVDITDLEVFIEGPEPAPD